MVKMKNDPNIFAINDPCIYHEMVMTPIGSLTVIASEKGLKKITQISIPDTHQKPNVHTNLAVNQLKTYFEEGKNIKFDIIPDFDGYSVFSVKVWNELQKIPYGTTISYTELANRLGDPLCIRAAASANGRNPIPIIIPCHRVIGSNGSLTGFAWGLDIKRKLLSIENPAKYSIVQQSLF